MKPEPKPYQYTKAREVNNGRAVVIDIEVLIALHQHNHFFKVQPVTPRGRK